MTKPNTTGHWSQIREKGVYFGLRFMLLAYRMGGRYLFALFLYPVIFYFFIFGRDERCASRDFLCRVYDFSEAKRPKNGPPGLRHVFRHFLVFGDAILDKFAAWSGMSGDFEVVYKNSIAFEKMQKLGRGGMLIVSHLGNSEVSRAIASLSREMRIVVLVHTKHSENFNRLMREVNPDAQVSMIETVEIGPETAINLQECIERGELVVIAGDRTPVMRSSRVSWVPFLGRSAPFPQGPYILANLLKCPVGLLFCLKRERTYHVIFEPFADRIILSRRTRAADLNELSARFAARLTYYAARHPYQWFNFFDFWNQASKINDETVGDSDREKDSEAKPVRTGDL